MKNNELKVYYGGGLNQNLDKAIENCLKHFGYKKWASGMSLEGVRDRAFDYNKSNKAIHPTRKLAGDRSVRHRKLKGDIHEIKYRL